MCSKMKIAKKYKTLSCVYVKANERKERKERNKYPPLWVMSGEGKNGKEGKVWLLFTLRRKTRVVEKEMYEKKRKYVLTFLLLCTVIKK